MQGLVTLWESLERGSHRKLLSQEGCGQSAPLKALWWQAGPYSGRPVLLSLGAVICTWGYSPPCWPVARLQMMIPALPLLTMWLVWEV